MTPFQVLLSTTQMIWFTSLRIKYGYPYTRSYLINTLLARINGDDKMVNISYMERKAARHWEKNLSFPVIHNVGNVGI